MELAGLKLLLLTILAIVFTVALTFATLEVPMVLNHILVDLFGFPDYNPAINPDLIEEFMSSHFIRPMGYASLAILIVLIAIGFVTKRTGLSALGSMALFLPTFGHFAAYMFFLSGIGMLRLLWMPALGISINILRLGDVVYLPYMVMTYSLAVLFSLFGLDPGSPLTQALMRARMARYYWDGFHIDFRVPLPCVLIGLGLLLFLLGTVAWLYARFQGKRTVDFWIYRHSRHPQYLGWLVWSYGVMLFGALTPVVRGGANPGASFPWVISSLLITCVALAEEVRMTEKHGEEYAIYRERTPFMLPLPKTVSKAMTLPIRVVLKKDRPESGNEILVVFLTYATLLVLFSLPFVLLNWPSPLGWSEWP